MKRRQPSMWCALAAGVLAALLAAPAGARDFEQSVPARPGGELHVDLDGGSIEVESHREDSVRVEAWTSGLGARAMDFHLKSEGDRVLVEGVDGGWLSLLGGPRVRVRVRVPTHFSVDLETHGGSVDVEDVQGRVRARTSGGPVSVDRIVGDVEVETSGGAIDASEVHGDLRAHTSGGKIRIRDAGGRVEVETSGGPIRIRDARGPVQARTSGGSISTRFTGAPAGHLETSGGSIEVEFPEGAGVALDARTSGGRVELPEQATLRGTRAPGEVVGALNGGGDDLALQTSGGNIRIRLR